MKRWRCTRCGYIHLGEQPPEVCPMPDCGASAEDFQELVEELVS